MKRAIAGLAILPVLTAALAAQQNPFRPSSGTVKSALVQYTLMGDETGTEELASTADRRAIRTNGTTRVFGKDMKMNRLEIDTRDSSYRVDLDKKEGYRAASGTTVMAAEYDQLSDAEKTRFQANMRDLASVFAQAFGAGAIGTAGDVKGRETVAGQACEVRQMGTFTVCTPPGTPDIPLRVQGELFCLRINKVATTAVFNGTVPPDRFAVPADVKWKGGERDAMSEEDARKFVHYMASQDVTDSLAKARAQLQAAQDSARARAQASGGAASADSLTPDQREQMCKTMREGIQLHVQVSPPNPGRMVQQGVAARVSSAQAMAQALAGAADSAKARAKGGLMKKLKPRFP